MCELLREEQQSGKPLHRPDGNRAATWTRIRPFAIDKFAVSNTQFQKFVRATKYRTEADTLQWSFVLEYLASPEVVAEVDGPEGYGRVKDGEQRSESTPFNPQSTPWPLLAATA